MGDLMSGSYSNEKLANKYGNFLVPAYKIKVNGTDLVTAKSWMLRKWSSPCPLKLPVLC